MNPSPERMYCSLIAPNSSWPAVSKTVKTQVLIILLKNEGVMVWNHEDFNIHTFSDRYCIETETINTSHYRLQTQNLHEAINKACSHPENSVKYESYPVWDSLTVQPCLLAVHCTDLGVRIFNCWVIIGHKVRLWETFSNQQQTYRWL